MLRVLLILLSVLIAALYFAQNSTGVFTPTFWNYNIDKGLPSNETYDIITDDDGKVWIATDNGLGCYDGYKMKTFRIEDGLVDNVVYTFFKDYKGRIWCFGANHKLCYIEHGKIHAYAFNDVIEKKY